MLVYFPVKDEKTGWNVVIIPSEQLVLIMNRLIQKMPGKRGYVTDRYYDFNYAFKTSEAAWRFIRNDPVTEDDVYSKVELFPDKQWAAQHLSKRDLRILKERNQQNDKDQN